MRLVIVSLLLMTMACNEAPRPNKRALESNAMVLEEMTKTTKQIKDELTNKGFEIFDYVDEESKDTVLMQQYFIAFLKRGPNRSQNKKETDSLQTLRSSTTSSWSDGNAIGCCPVLPTGRKRNKGVW